jgi:hypothetical protein
MQEKEYYTPKITSNGAQLESYLKQLKELTDKINTFKLEAVFSLEENSNLIEHSETEHQ